MNSADTRALLEDARQTTGKSKYAFARAAGMAPQSYNEYLKAGEKCREMRVSKLKQVLQANGLVLELSFKKAEEYPLSAIRLPLPFPRRPRVGCHCLARSDMLFTSLQDSGTSDIFINIPQNTR